MLPPIKHFEQLWEDAERVFAEFNQSEDNDSIINNIIQSLNDLKSSENKQFLFGQIIFGLCKLSFKLNINSYQVLLEAINDYKSSCLEVDDE